MPQPFKLNEFISEMNKTGFAKPSYFMMFINLPNALLSRFPEFGNSMALRVESASLPTRAILTHEQRYYGPVRRVPYGTNTQDLNFSVILSEDMREREILLRWQDILVGNSRTRGNSDRTALFDAGYYDDGVTGASVELRTYATSPRLQSGTNSGRSFFGEVSEVARAVGFDPSVVTNPLGFNLSRANDRTINAAYTIKLVEPFPLNIAEVPLSWGDDSYARLNVQMQYRYAEEVNSFYSGEDLLGGRGAFSDLLRNGIQSFNRFRPIISAIRGQGISGAIDNFAGQVRTNALNNVRSLIGGI